MRQAPSPIKESPSGPERGAPLGTGPAALSRPERGGFPMAVVQTLQLPDGRSLCVRRWPGAGEPLVLLHGLLDSSEGWNYLAGLPCERIAFDLPGFGHSDPPTRGSLAGYAHDVAAGLDALGVERFNLIGHSLGGGVAAALAEMMPERVGALVLLAPVGFGRIPLAEAVSLPGIRHLVQGALPVALSSRTAITATYLTMVSNGLAPEPALVDRLCHHGGELMAGAREGTRAAADAGRARDAFHHRRLSYRGPVYAIWGDHDRLVPPSHSAGVRTALPQARVTIWGGMGHHPIRERFEDLVATIERAAGAAAGAAAAAAGAMGAAAGTVGAAAGAVGAAAGAVGAAAGAVGATAGAAGAAAPAAVAA